MQWGCKGQENSTSWIFGRVLVTLAARVAPSDSGSPRHPHPNKRAHVVAALPLATAAISSLTVSHPSSTAQFCVHLQPGRQSTSSASDLAPCAFHPRLHIRCSLHPRL